jgi:hypothetical protein
MHEIGGRIDAAGEVGGSGHPYGIAVLERAQHVDRLGLLERRRFQRRKLREKRPPERDDADLLENRRVRRSVLPGQWMP